tara:strand:- start:39 stop:920 length:882 start_codon:yes stop_codon:yes gene_type:complete
MDVKRKILEINKENIPLEEKNKKIQAILLSNTSIKKTTENNKENNKENKDKDVLNKIVCSHYTNKCMVYCEECEDFFNCRLCHDDMVYGHTFDRFNIKKIKCDECNTEQPPGKNCVNCNIEFANYMCFECGLYETLKDNSIYHCDKCKICRKGKKEDFVHCDKCNGCISKESIDTHICISDSINSDCPICLENIFYSRKPIMSIKCGHYIHKECFMEHIKSSYKCPLCLISVCDMSSQWESIDNLLELNPIPEEYRKNVEILCYDCKKHSVSEFHFDYIKCNNCKSYNTTIKN